MPIKMQITVNIHEVSVVTGLLLLNSTKMHMCMLESNFSTLQS